MDKPIACAAMLMLCLAGCGSAPKVLDDPRSGEVGVTEVITAEPVEFRLQLEQNEVFYPPLPSASNAPPVYPEALLSKRLPIQSVCVSVGIDENGNVITTKPVDQAPDCSLAMNAESAFYQAAVEAISGWQFDPAFRCSVPEGKSLKDGCDPFYGEEIPQAVSLIFRFEFKQVNGRGTVSVN